MPQDVSVNDVDFAEVEIVRDEPQQTETPPAEIFTISYQKPHNLEGAGGGNPLPTRSPKNPINTGVVLDNHLEREGDEEVDERREERDIGGCGNGTSEPATIPPCENAAEVGQIPKKPNKYRGF